MCTEKKCKIRQEEATSTESLPNVTKDAFVVEQSDASNFVTLKTSVFTKTCETCKKCLAKYKCPRCLMWNCSLSCVLQHKTEKDCDGKRCPIVQVAVNQFNDQIMRQDIQFLDRTAQVAERASRITARHFSSSLNWKNTGGIRKRFLSIPSLRKKCEERHIHIHFLSPEFCRRRENTTQLTRKAKRLAWRVAWIFPEWNRLSYVDAVVSEETILQDLLQRFVISNHICTPDGSNQQSCSSNQFPLILENSSTSPFYENYEILLKNYIIGKTKETLDSVSSAVPRWFILNKRKKLREVLENKHIYEFPEFYVVSVNMIRNSDDSCDVSKTIYMRSDTSGLANCEIHNDPKNGFLLSNSVGPHEILQLMDSFSSSSAVIVSLREAGPE